MSVQELQIVTKPKLTTNKQLEDDFTEEIFRRVEMTSQTRKPTFIFFLPQSRPKEEFYENIKPLLKEDQQMQDAIIVSISNNTEKSDAYLDETKFVFKLRVNMVLTEGGLDIARNKDSFERLTKTLINEYLFREWEERKETKEDIMPTVRSKVDRPFEERVLRFLKDNCVEVSHISEKLDGIKELLLEQKHCKDAEPERVFDKYLQELEELRSHLKELKEPVALLILNDYKAQYINSLLFALEGFDVPQVHRGMQIKQFLAYKWTENWIIDVGSAEDLGFGGAVLDKFSKNKNIAIIVVQQRGSTTDLKKEQMKIKSKSIRDGASWHIVVAMETTDDCCKDSPCAKNELVQVSRENKIEANRVHFVKNFTDKERDSNPSLIHLTVLKNIMDCVKEQQVSTPFSEKLWFRVFLVTSLILLPVLTFWENPTMGFNNVYHLFQICYGCVWSYIWQD